MKITKFQLKEIIKEEVAISESWALAARAGAGFLQLMGSSTGRKMIAGVLRGIGAVMKFSTGANKWALEKAGFESPDFVRELEGSIEAGPGELANFIEGMNDEEALKLGEIATLAENPPSAIEAPPLQEAKFRKITKSQLKEIIKEEIEVTLTNEEAAEMFGDEILEELDEGIENLTPENIQMAFEMVMQVAKNLAPAAIPAATFAMLKQLKAQALGEEFGTPEAPLKDPSEWVPADGSEM